MSEKIKKEIYGTLIVRDEVYNLLSPFPLKSLDGWLPYGTLTFLVTGEHGGQVRHLLVKGDFLIDYANAGKLIEVKGAA